MHIAPVEGVVCSVIDVFEHFDYDVEVMLSCWINTVVIIIGGNSVV